MNLTDTTSGSGRRTDDAVAAVRLEPGMTVWTTVPDGDDFGLPLVRPTRSRRAAVPRTVRSRLRESGGIVIRFTDGTKARPVHGRTAFLLTDPGEQPD